MSFGSVVAEISNYVVLVGTCGAIGLIWKLRAAQVDALKATNETLQARIEIAEATSFERYVEQTKAMKQVFEEQLEQKDQEIADARAQGKADEMKDLEETRAWIEAANASTGATLDAFKVSLPEADWDKILSQVKRYQLSGETEEKFKERMWLMEERKREGE